MRREKIKNKSKINLIYNSKLIDNDTGWKIKRKTYNLIWSPARNDPIDYQIKDFSFHAFKDEIRHSTGNFSPFLRRKLYSKHSMHAKMSLEEEEILSFKDLDV